MKLVMIEWMDAHSGNGWQSIEEIRKSCEPVYCRSVGWLASEKNGHKVIVPHISGEKNGDIMIHGRGDLTIPTKAILKITILKNK